VKFAFIEAEKAHFPVSVLCSVLGVSRSGFYAWRKRPKSSRASEDAVLAKKIIKVYTLSRGTYGSPRVHAELREQGEVVGRKRIARLMRDRGLVARSKRRFRPTTTDSNHSQPVAENLLNRSFERILPNQAWVGDITYIPTGEGWLYLAVLIDLFSRRVVGWAMSDRIDRQLTLNALEMAIVNRGRAVKDVLHHSDRGSQYASADYRQALVDRGLVASMSRKGNCWDNAVAESFFSTLKWELIHRRPFETRSDARRAIFEYIEVFYNRRRRHSALGYLSPMQFETNTARFMSLLA
jgi:transposase InsO family protein